MTDSTGPAAGSGAPFRLLDALFADEPMRAVWSEAATVMAWLDVEAALAAAQAEVGLISAADAEAIGAVCRVENIDLPALWAGARTVGYPILPLVRQIAALLPPGPSGRVHYGVTTQDIMDSGLALQLGRSCDRLVELATRFGDALAELAVEHSDLVMAARTHGQQAVPTTFGAKVATFLLAVERSLRDLRDVGHAVRTVALHGAGGTNAAMGPAASQVRAALARRLGLADSLVPWHVVRDEVVRFAQVAARLAATCVRFSREVVDLSRTEIAEVRERGGHHRGASSTMPQKTNPISSESAVGFGVSAGAGAAMLLRAMEAGHERSAGEWQVEWAALPQVAEHTAVAVALCVDTAATLQVFPDAMAANLRADGGLLMSEALMMRLAPVLGQGPAHDAVYAAAVRARADGGDLVAECAAALPAEVRDRVGSLDLAPADYVGEAPAIAIAAAESWRRTREEPRPRTGSTVDRTPIEGARA
jgi:3-carboxy-cis,cis-muconate cycloisomerase